MPLALLLAGATARACDTPVYAYTIQMWVPDPYRVYYFHSGREDPADREVNLFLAKTAEDPKAETNLRFESVDTSDPSAVGSGMVAKVWGHNRSRKLPFHAIITPRGMTLAVERLTPASARAMLRSSKRENLANLLGQGKMGVLLLLLGPDAQENETARSVTQAAIAEAAKSGLDAGLLEIKRADASEKWLVRQMLCVEDDLNELSRTMLFGTFGRGHIIEPFVGRGITHENVLELIGFMSGPCSCEVKETAPGTDLLMTCDWDERVAGWAEPAGYGTGGYTEIPVAELSVSPPSAPDQSRSAPSAPTPPAPKLAPSPAPDKSAPPAAASKPPRPVPTRAPNPAPRPPPAGPAAAEAKPIVPGAEASTVPLDAPAPLDEATRGPDLSSARLPPATAMAHPSLSSRLGLPLGIAVGVLTFGAILGGLALVWFRREQ